MSTLRSALDELRVEDLRSVSDDGLAADLDELERASRVLEAERSRRLAEFERRRAFATDGHLSTSSWLAHRQGLARSVADAVVRRATALAEMPGAAEAFGAGDVSESAVRVLVSAREGCPEAFAGSEEGSSRRPERCPSASCAGSSTLGASPPIRSERSRTRTACSSVGA